MTSLNFSVVIPAYNEEKRIARAIKSVLTQTLPASEIIVVDDGSTDGTRAVVESFGNRVRYVYQQNKKLAAARNTGINAANFEWIAFLDSDDEWKPNHLQDISFAISGDSTIAWACTGWERWIEGGQFEYAMCYSGPVKDGRIIEDFFFAQSKQGFALPSAMAINRQVLIKTGGFDESIGIYGEDLDMWFRLALSNLKIAYSKNNSVIYWQRPGSITSTWKGDSRHYLNRIKKTLSVLEHYDQPLPSNYHLPLFTWFVSNIKSALHDHNKQVIHEIRSKYKQYIPTIWWVFAFVAEFTPVIIWRYVINIMNLLRRYV